MKQFKSITTVQGAKEPEAEAREVWAEDCHRYGLPMDKTTVQFIECDPATLKPIHLS
jgi:hypothetical protein